MIAQSENYNNNQLYSLEALERACGENKSFLNHMLQVFINENTKAVDDIRKAYALKNIAEVRSIAHRIKPSINHLKMISVLSDLRSMENWEGSLPDLEVLINKTCFIITEVIKDLKGHSYLNK